MAAAGLTDVMAIMLRQCRRRPTRSKVSKAGYVITPGTQSAVVANGTTNVLGNFTASPASIPVVFWWMPPTDCRLQWHRPSGWCGWCGGCHRHKWNIQLSARRVVRVGVEVLLMRGYHCTKPAGHFFGGRIRRSPLVAVTETGSVMAVLESVAGDPLSADWLD